MTAEPLPIEVVEADITTLDVDAIVNAANESLLGGGGVDGAIHAAAGPALLRACRALPEHSRGVRCPTGEARMTPGFRLPARFVIHTVGPVWQGGACSEPEQLAQCYASIFARVRAHALATIAIPAIACGVYGYPLEQAVAIAVREVREALRAGTQYPQRVVFCAFGARVAQACREAVADQADV